MKVLRIAFLSTLGLVLLLGVILSARVYLDSGARATSLVNEARELEREGKPAQAIQVYRKAADKAPKKIDAVIPYLQRAEDISKEEFRKRALPFTEADYLYPQQLRVLIAAARRTDEKELLEIFARRLLSDFPGESTSLTLAADSFFTAGDRERAAGLYEAAIQADPSNNEAKLHYAQLLLNTGESINSIRAKVFLRSAGEGSGEVALRALLMLVSNPNLALTVQERSEYLKKVAEHEAFQREDKLLTGNLPLLRVLGSQMMMVDPELAHQVGEWRLQHPDADKEDVVSQVYLAQRVGRLDESRKLLERLKSDTDPVAASLRAFQQALQGDITKALEDLAAILGESPMNPHALNILLQIRDRGAADEKWLSPTERQSLNELLLAHEGAPMEVRLEAVITLLALQPLKQQQVMEHAMRVMQPHHVILASFLVNNGRAAEALMVANEKAAAENSALGRLRVLGLLGLNRIEDARAQLTSLGSLPPIEDRMLNLLVEVSAGNLEGARVLWQEAFQMVSSAEDDSRLLVLARTGLQLGDAKYSLDAFRLAFERGLSLTEGDWLSYFSLLLETRQEDRAKVVAERMVRENPNNPIFINNAAYLNLLSGQELARSLRIVQETIKEHPDMPNLRMTLALAYLLNGSPREALTTAEAAQQYWDEPPPAARAIYAAILAANNQVGLARALAMPIDRNLLLQMERELLSRHLPSN